MKTVYDILNDVHTDIDVYNIEVMSDIETKKMQKKCSNTIRKSKARNKRMVASIAWIIVTVVAIGGTIYAYSENLLGDVYEEQATDYEENVHYDKELIESQYNEEIIMESNVKSDIIEFEVLLAAKGERSIMYSILVTHNYDTSKGKVLLSMYDDYPDEGISYGLGYGWTFTKYDSVILNESQEIHNVTMIVDDTVDMAKFNELIIEVSPTFYGIYDEKIKSDFYESINEASYWHITFPIVQTYNDYYYDVKNVEIGDTGYTVDGIYVTPSGITVEYIWNGLTTTSKDLRLSAIMTNGDKLGEFRMNGGTVTSGRAEMTYVFDALIKTEDISAVEIEGQLIELK